ncbi:MAG TPA: hypothetical protein VNT03_14330, partial [Baekduia sp.]|nr:hypothetical protein [Baekduia sp.]
MTPRRTEPDPPDREPVLSEADSEAVGRRIQELAATVEAPPALRTRLGEAQRDRPRRARARSRGARFALPALAAGGLAAVVAVVLVL